MKKSALLIFTFLFIISFAGYTLSLEFANKTQAIGNTSGNLNNKGIYASKGDWIYYSSFSKNGGLYRARINGEEKAKIYDVKFPWFMNIAGDYIYYSGDAWKLTKLKLDGSEKKILDNNAFHINVIGDWIYYVKGSLQDGYIYKMKVDGTEKQKIIGDHASQIAVSNNWIYYTSYYSKLIKVDLEGRNKTKLLEGRISELNVINDWIYFNLNGALYKIKTDGKNLTKLSNDNAVNINVAGGWIYYSIFNKPGYLKKLVKIRTDGLDRQLLSETKASYIHVLDNYILFYDLNRGQIEKIKS